MEFGCIGFSELIDNSCLNESGHSHHEAHYNNHNNMSLEEFLSKIDYLFNIGNVYNEMIKAEKLEVHKIFPPSARLRELLDNLTRLEAMGIKSIFPFEIMAVDNNFKNDFLVAIKTAYMNCRIYNSRQNSESNPSDVRKVYYKFWLEKIKGDD